jgi:hypothetical protein
MAAKFSGAMTEGDTVQSIADHVRQLMSKTMLILMMITVSNAISEAIMPHEPIIPNKGSDSIDSAVSI